MHVCEPSGSHPDLQKVAESTRTKSRVARFLSVLSQLMIMMIDGQWLRLFISRFNCHLPRCLLQNLRRGPSPHAELRHVLHVATRSGRARRSVLGHFRPMNRCSSPLMDKLPLSRPKCRRDRPGLASPTGLRLDQLKS